MSSYQHSNDTVAGDALSLVNIARQAFGLPMLSDLPSGIRANSEDCVLSRALRPITGEIGVSGSVRFGREDVAETVAALWGTEVDSFGSVRTPAALHALWSRFDDNEYPTLKA